MLAYNQVLKENHMADNSYTFEVSACTETIAAKTMSSKGARSSEWEWVRSHRIERMIVLIFYRGSGTIEILWIKNNVHSNSQLAYKDIE